VRRNLSIRELPATVRFRRTGVPGAWLARPSPSGAGKISECEHRAA
jgi:hypothetical protein